MAYVHFDRHYAPCAFLVVRKDGDPYKESDTLLIQTDWDYPSIASYMGWTPCHECDATDGTINCPHKKASDMIQEAFVWIEDRAGEEFEFLEEYFQDVKALLSE